MIAQAVTLHKTKSTSFIQTTMLTREFMRGLDLPIITYTVTLSYLVRE